MKRENDQLQEMSFWGHLDVLRGTLIRCAIVVISFMVVLFIFMPYIFENVILAPCNSDFILYRLFNKLSEGSSLVPEFVNTTSEIQLINIKLAAQFYAHMSTSGWMAFLISFPILLYLLWGFVSPALYEKERRGIKRAFLFGNIMFYSGVAVGYFLVFPITLRFLAEYSLSDKIPNQISLDSYMDNFIMINLLMGIVFELPLLAWLLGKMGILTRNFFKKYRRHAIVALTILAAIITPTGDPFSLMIVFIPIYALWELSAFLVKPDTTTTEYPKSL